MVELNKLISDKFIEKDIEFKNFSEEHGDLVNFNVKPLFWYSQSNEVAKKLFSFLLQNFMNRYLFNLMLRKSPNITSWALNDVDLTENNLKRFSFEQSFVKLYKCHDCQYLLKRIYAPELSSIETDEIADCPNCGLKKLISPMDYESNFIMIRKDLTNFFDKLRHDGILHLKEYILCSECGVELGAKDDLSGQNMCQLCDGVVKTKTRDEFKDDFLNLCKSKPGLWFEWFVYEIANQIYENVEHGLILSYIDDEGNNKEKEVDIVALNDDKLILIECKNYLGHTPPREYKTIIDIAPFFDEVYVANFFKPHRDVIKKMILPGSNINVLNGNDIDEYFLNNELIISQLLIEDSLFGTETISRVSNDMKISVINQIFGNVSDRSMIKALTNIINYQSVDSKFLLDNFSENLNQIFGSELKLISNVFESREDITDSLKLINSYCSRFDKDQLSNMINPSQVLNSIIGVNKLAENYDAQIRKLYKRLFNLYDKEDFDLTIIENNFLFDQMFDDLYYSYFENYEWRKRVSTLSLINYIFDKISQSKIHLFTELIEKEFSKSDFHSGTVVDKMFYIFFNFKHKFEDSDKSKISESSQYLKENGINDFVRSSAGLFIDQINAD